MATVEEVIDNTDSRMQKSVEALQRDLNTVRTGRASPALVEGINVDYYGVPTPLNQLATISVPEARVLMIQPWDKQVMKEVEKGLLTSDMGLVPNNDGTAIRINLPAPTEERRKELVRIVGKKVEEGLISIRNIRRDSLESFRSMEKSKDLSSDDSHRAQEQLQGVTDRFSGQINEIKASKEAEVLEV